MAEPELLVSRDDRVATVLLNRPARRNALTAGLLKELGAAMEALRGTVRVVILAGAGEEAFSAGYEIGDIPTGLGPAEAAERLDRHPLQEALRVVREFPAPVITRIRGVTLGAGLDLAMACDLRVAAAGSRFGITPPSWGCSITGPGCAGPWTWSGSGAPKSSSCFNLLSAPAAPAPEARAEILRLTARCYGSLDLQEGQRAFLEKRKPRFEGR